MPERRAEDARIKKIAEGYDKWRKTTIVILAILALIQALLATASIYLIDQNSNRADEARTLSEQNAKVIHDLRDVVKTIQVQRAQTTRTTCLDQNARYDNAIRDLNAQVKRIKPTLNARELARLNASIDGSKKLIRSLAPPLDCEKRVKAVLGQKGGDLNAPRPKGQTPVIER